MPCAVSCARRMCAGDDRLEAAPLQPAARARAPAPSRARTAGPTSSGRVSPRPVEHVRHRLAVADEVELGDPSRGCADLAQEQLVQRAARPRSRGGTRSRACCPGARRPGGRRPRRAPRPPRRARRSTGARMNTARTGGPSMPGMSQVGLERADLAAERVARAGVVGQPEVLAVEHDHARAGAEHRRAGAHELAQRLGEALALDPERHRGRLAAGHDQPVEALELARARAPRARRRRARAAAAHVRLEVALQREDADAAALTSRGWRGAAAPRACASRATAIAVPRPSEARATRSGSWKWVVASTIARGAAWRGPRT